MAPCPIRWACTLVLLNGRNCWNKVCVFFPTCRRFGTVSIPIWVPSLIYEWLWAWSWTHLLSKGHTFLSLSRQKYGALLPFHLVLPKQGSFVVIAPEAYHAVFRLAYEISFAVNYLNSSCFECWQTTASFPVSACLPAREAISFALLSCILFTKSIYRLKNMASEGRPARYHKVAKIRATMIHTNMALMVSKYRNRIHLCHRNYKSTVRK